MIVDTFDAPAALAHEVRSDDVGVAPVTSLHQHIGLDDVDELERRVLIEDRHEVDALERRQHFRALRLREDRSSGTLTEPADGCIAVDTDHETITEASRFAERADMPSMEDIEASVGEDDGSPRPALGGDGVADRRAIENLTHAATVLRRESWRQASRSGSTGKDSRMRASTCALAMAVLLAGGSPDVGALEVGNPAKALEEVTIAIGVNNARFVLAVGRRDVETLRDLYTKDSALLFPGYPMIAGPKAIHAFWRDVLGEGASATLNTDTIEQDCNVAVETGIGVLALRQAGREPRTLNGKYVVVWKRDEDGSWKMYRQMWNDMPLPK